MPDDTPSQDLEKTRHEFKFHGSASEYFGIWIVNLVLTVLTIGIYSAWAKVRRNRYFYGNTELGGYRFAYLATPIQILIGRIIVVAFLIALNLMVTFFPTVALVMAVPFAALLPELKRRGLRFSARTTAYRNVRFDFDGGYGGALAAFLVAPVLALFSFGLLAPIGSRLTQSYVFDNLSYGGRRFTMDATVGGYYLIWWMPAAVMFGGLLFTFMMVTGRPVDPAIVEASQWTPLAMIVPLYLLLIAVVGTSTMLYAAGVRNVTFNAARLDGRHDLNSEVNEWRYVWVMVSNFVVTVLSAGLMRPWAAVRHARFLAGSTALLSAGNLDTYADAVAQTGGAVGSEYVDIEGLELGL